MSTAITSDPQATLFRVLHFIFVLLILYIGFNLVIVKEDDYQKKVVAEMQTAKEKLPNKDWEAIQIKAGRRHQKLMYDSGALEMLKQMLIHNTDTAIDRALEEKAMQWNYRVVNNIQVLHYQVMYRTAVMEYWIIICIPFVLCMLITGFYKWKIKQYGFGGTSTNLTRLSLKALWLSMLLTISYFITPNIFNEYSLYIPLFVIVLFTIASERIIQSYQKSS